jgi:hypothetical protein
VAAKGRVLRAKAKAVPAYARLVKGKRCKQKVVY